MITAVLRHTYFSGEQSYQEGAKSAAKIYDSHKILYLVRAQLLLDPRFSRAVFIYSLLYFTSNVVHCSS